MIATRAELERAIRDAKAIAARLPFSTPSAKTEREQIAGVLVNLADFAQRFADRAAAEPRLGTRAFPKGDR
jgi:hypothetical protein